MQFSEPILNGDVDWVNNSQEYFLVTGISNRPGPPTFPPVSGETQSATAGQLFDANGNNVDIMYYWQYQASVVAGSLSDEVYEYTAIWQKNKMLVPPGWKLNNPGSFYGFYMTLDELVEMMKKGGYP